MMGGRRPRGGSSAARRPHPCQLLARRRVQVDMRLLLALAALLLAAPAVASAQTVNAPPGNSGISQYLEVVPAASGGKPTKAIRKSGVTPPAALQRAGRDGERLAAIAAGTSPAPAAEALGQRRASHVSSESNAPSGARGEVGEAKGESGDSSRKALAAAFTGTGTGGSGGLGVPLIVPMLLSAVVVGVMAWGARRRGTPE